MRNPAVQEILDKHVDNIAGVRGAVVVSSDGLHLYWSHFDEATAERRAPIGASLGSLARRVAAEEGAGAVRRTMVEMEDGFFIVAHIGQRSSVAVSTKPEVDLGIVGYELTLLAKRLHGVLDAEARHQPAVGARRS